MALELNNPWPMGSSEVPPTPDTVPCRANSSRTVAIPFRVLSPTTQPSGLGQPKRQKPAERLSWSSFSLQRIWNKGARITRVYQARHDPLTRFRTLSAVCFSLALPGLFHPGTLMGFSLQSVILRRSRSASRRPLPSCCYPRRHSGMTPTASPPRRERRREASFRVLLPFGARTDERGV